MPVDRLFHDGSLTVGSMLQFSGPEHQHLKVLRITVGDQIQVVNGQGALATAEIAENDKRSAHVRVVQSTQEAPGEFKLEILQAIPRLNRLDTIVEKGTELGMTHLSLFPGERSEKEN